MCGGATQRKGLDLSQVLASLVRGAEKGGLKETCGMFRAREQGWSLRQSAGQTRIRDWRFIERP
jgi:hypothetical protein